MGALWVCSAWLLVPVVLDCLAVQHGGISRMAKVLATTHIIKMERHRFTASLAGLLVKSVK